MARQLLLLGLMARQLLLLVPKARLLSRCGLLWIWGLD